MKTATGLGTILANYSCIFMVFWKAWGLYRKTGPRQVPRLNRAIFASAVVGFPPAVIATVLGFLLVVRTAW